MEQMSHTDSFIPLTSHCFWADGRVFCDADVRLECNVCRRHRTHSTEDLDEGHSCTDRMA